MTYEMHTYFEKLYQDQIETLPQTLGGNSSVYLLQKQVEKLSKKLIELNSSNKPGKKKPSKPSKA